MPTSCICPRPVCNPAPSTDTIQGISLTSARPLRSSSDMVLNTCVGIHSYKAATTPASSEEDSLSDEIDDIEASSESRSGTGGVLSQ